MKERGGEQIKYGYVSYCKGTSKFWGLTEQERVKELDRIKREAEKYGLKMVLRGEPYGVSEDILLVFESEKGLDILNKFQNETYQPFESGRTILVVLK